MTKPPHSPAPDIPASSDDITIGADFVPIAIIFEPRVITRLANVPVLPLISTPASIVKVTFLTEEPSERLPSSPSSTFPLPTVTRPSIRYSTPPFRRKSETIVGGSKQTPVDTSVVVTGHVASATSGLPTEPSTVHPAHQASLVVGLTAPINRVGSSQFTSATDSG